MSSDKAVVDSEPVAFTNEEAKQILHQFAKEIGSFELDFYNFDELNYEEQSESDKSANLPDADSASNKC